MSQLLPGDSLRGKNRSFGAGNEEWLLDSRNDASQASADPAAHGRLCRELRGESQTRDDWSESGEHRHRAACIEPGIVCPRGVATEEIGDEPALSHRSVVGREG